MDTAKLIYRILSGLEKRVPENAQTRVFFIDSVAARYGEAVVHAVLRMLVQAGYVSGFAAHLLPEDPQITLNGLEYLLLNPLMQKVALEVMRGTERA